MNELSLSVSQMGYDLLASLNQFNVLWYTYFTEGEENKKE